MLHVASLRSNGTLMGRLIRQMNDWVGVVAAVATGA